MIKAKGSSALKGMIVPVAAMILITSLLWVPTPAANANTATAPEAPTNLAATSGNLQVTLTWEAPSSNGGADITGYEYRHHFGVSSQSWPAWTSAGTALTVTVTGLLNGRDYTFEVRAVNSVGGGTASSIEATPTGAGPLTALSVEARAPPVADPCQFTDRAQSAPHSVPAPTSIQSQSEHGDTHLTFNATTETGYGKQLRMVGDLGLWGILVRGARRGS